MFMRIYDEALCNLVIRSFYFLARGTYLEHMHPDLALLSLLLNKACAVKTDSSGRICIILNVLSGRETLAFFLELF